MMDITILGSAASTPTPDRSLPAIAVRIDGDILLLDCGEGTQRQMMRLGVSYAKISAIFISHLHLDHYLGVFGMLETLRLNGRTNQIPLFGPIGSARVFARSKLLDIHEIEPSAAALKKPLFSINEHDVYAFQVQHGAGEESYGFKIVERPRRRFHEQKAHTAGLKGSMFTEIQKKGSIKIGAKTIKLDDISYMQEGKKLVYSGDTIYCKALIKAAEGADLLIHDSTFDETQRELADERSHATAADAAKAAKESGAKQLMLFHIGGRFHDTTPLLQEAKAIFSNTLVAEDGLKLTL